MRYLSKALINDLKKKMVILAGPRQCGKTTLAKSLLDSKGTYLNWDISRDRKIIREQLWNKDSSLLVFDEIHKEKKWKNILKGIVDEFHNKPPILVTGSARLDVFRNSGDALTGRHYFYHLHPVDISESSLFLPKMNLKSRTDLLLKTGGFPEALLNPKDSERLRNDRMEMILKEDMRDLSKMANWQAMADLIELLRERVGKSINYDSLSQDLGISPPTVKNWILLLEKLYVIFLLKPYSSSLARGIRKEKRLYFYDCAAAYDDTGGAQLENLVACSLLKQIQFKKDTLGENWDLFYLRDKEKREIDFVLTLNRKVSHLIEVKKSEVSLHSHIYYYSRILNPKHSIQLVLELNRPLEKNGMKILPLASFLESF